MDALWCPTCQEPLAKLENGEVECTADDCTYRGAPLQ